MKALCHWHDDFFKKFADLLEWRVNRRSGDPADLDDETPSLLDDSTVRYRYRTLPEILADIPALEGGSVKEVACFTTAAAAMQYFEMANAAGQLVIDASFLYESDLLEAYTK